MTEQTRIPVPETSSVLERASRSFGLGEGTAPPVPVLPHARRAKAPPVQAAEREPAQVAPVPFAGPTFPVDRERLAELGFAVPGSQITAILEEFRIVKRQLMLAAAEARADGLANANRILIASANPGEGKTFCAVNLALSIAAERDTEVLLVDADFAKPSVLSTLGLPSGPGLMDALSDPAVSVADCVIGTDVPGLLVLPAGEATVSDTEYLASSRTARVLAQLDAPNRIVILDSPPVLAASPATELAHHVGQTLVVVRADRTSEAAVKDALSLLAGCESLQLLLNCVAFSPTGRKFGTYYGYGE